MKSPRVACLSSLTLLLAMIGAPALAQTDSRFAVGAEFRIRTSDHAEAQDAARTKLGPGPLWRFGHGRAGWGFHWGLNWYAVDIERSIGGLTTELGELHVRPFMAGYGYTYPANRRLNITADVLGGYAIGSIGLSPTAIAAYQNRMGARSVDASASNTLVLNPEVGVWYDLNRKFGLSVNAGYMIARPEVEVTSTAGTDRRTARADQFSLKVGVVYAVF